MAPVADDAKVTLIIPTAINMVLVANENIVYNLRKQQASDLQLLSIYKRAFLITNETDEIITIRQGVEE
jgi:hypothetical protein